MYLRKLSSLAAAAVLMIGAWADSFAVDWQYTKWNMSIDEAVAASDGLAKPSTPAEAGKKYQNTIVKLNAPYTSGEFKFLAFLHFDPTGHRLIAVSLELQNVQEASYLRVQLATKYGNPDETQMVAEILEIYVRHAEDEIVFSSTSDSAIIE